MRRLSWFVIPIAVLTLTIVALTSWMGVRAEEEEKAKAEEREWGEEVQGLRMSIQLQDHDEKNCGPVTLSIIVKNVGKGVAMYTESSVYRDFDLTIKDTEGKEVPLTKYGEHIRDPRLRFNLRLVKLQPGEQEEHSLIANRAYDMTLPGKYTITATLKIHDAENNKWVPVTSNTITVEVPR